MPDRRDFLKLLGALGLGALGSAVVDILTTKPIIKPAEAPQQVVQPYYSVMVQTPQGPNGPRPMVVSADGEVIVDENGRIVSDLGVYPTEGVNELGGYTQTAGIQEAIAYLLNTGGGVAFIRRGDYYPCKVIHVGVIKRQVQVIIQGEGLATRIHLYNNTGRGMAWAFTVGTPGNSPTADQAPPPIFRDLTFVNDVNEGPPVGPMVTGGYYTGGGAVGNGVILEDITVIDPPSLANKPGTPPSGIGWIWFNNSYGIRVRGFTYLGANPNSSGSTVIVSDGVTFTEIDESFFISTARGGVAVSSGTGTIQITNTQILGFNVGVNYGNTDGRSKLMTTNVVIGTDRGGVEAYGAQLFVNTPIYVDYGFIDALICCSRLGGVIKLLDSVSRINISDSEVHSLTIETITKNSPQSDLLLTIEGSRITGSGSGPLINIPQEYATNSTIRVRLINNEISKQASSGEWPLVTVPNNVVFEMRGNYVRMLNGFDVIIGLSQDLTSGFYEFSDNIIEAEAQPIYLLNGGVAINAPFIVSGNKFLTQTQLYKTPPTAQGGLMVSNNLNLVT
ncbi:hypothetical protein [Vulcanisaeta souniana]|uniref:Twin-arginine translocation signal domain-containing protein n=1 Tax=Vulcanisaeta souniana JCM 11219 TaxID=1293586 RepID=A0A830E8W5_9CREN|nr:hypothetical protein [Vulcanisaeta souniana]BDR91137.1 hypothetical protein Vsou_02300 [Vulcanisaeta souniana JCM 11219]GGI81121.1 hypothetical protein GCM10007112_17350 [Vulcanisaeta souniana JCM 11219]